MAASTFSTADLAEDGLELAAWSCVDRTDVALEGRDRSSVAAVVTSAAFSPLLGLDEEAFTAFADLSEPPLVGLGAPATTVTDRSDVTTKDFSAAASTDFTDPPLEGLFVTSAEAFSSTCTDLSTVISPLGELTLLLAEAFSSTDFSTDTAAASLDEPALEGLEAAVAVTSMTAVTISVVCCASSDFED